MSIKSLLQIILFLLILMIIGGIYFLYFYKEQTSSQAKFVDTIEKITLDNEKINQNLNNTNDMVDNDKIINNEIISKKQKKNTELTKSDTKKDLENKKIKNLTKEIEYITTNKNGDIYKILAQYGKTNLKNSNILELENVNGEVLSKDRSNIHISSNFAKYDYTNQNSKFYSNVAIKYDQNKINCDNLDLLINKNKAIAYGNVSIKNNNSNMKAQMVIIDLLTKDININSEEKIELLIN